MPVKLQQPPSGLTPDEQRVMDALVTAVLAFNDLEAAITPDEMRAFVEGIHQCQNVLGMRVVRRDHPDFWL
jgi:hypothetical protein